MKKILEKIFTAIGVIISVIFFVNRKKTPVDFSNAEKKAEEAAKTKEQEIEEKAGSDLVAESVNADAHLERIDREQDDFRERVRDRLNQNLFK